MRQHPWPLGIVLLQAIGALGVFAYPFVLMGSFFGLIAERTHTIDDVLGTAMVVLGVTYPLLWGALWVGSWVVRGRGRPRLALFLSAVPALVTVAAIVALAAGGVLDSRAEARQAREEDARLRAQNPLAADLVAVGLHPPPAGGPRLPEVIAGADPALLSKPVREFGTPLWIALRFSQLETWLDEGRTRKPFLDAARQLAARGARLSPQEERDDPCLPWLAATLASGVTLPDRGAERENPLVWAIALADAGPPGDDQLMARLEAVERSDPGQLTRETRTYGTPLGLALRRNHRVLAQVLVGRHARLSVRERADASLRARLEPMVRAELDPASAQAYLDELAAGDPGAR